MQNKQSLNNLKHILTVGVVTLLSLNLAACNTLSLKDSVGSIVKTKEHIHLVGQDQVSAFVIDKKSNQLLLIGRDYVYVVEDDQTGKAVKALLLLPKLDITRLNSTIGNKFYGYVNPEQYKKDNGITGIPVSVDPATGKFSVWIELSYHYNDNEAERDYLVKNGFDHYDVSKNAYLVSDFGGTKLEGKRLTGTLYKDQSPTVTALRAQASQNLQKNYPVSLYYSTESKAVNPRSLVIRTALSPFTLAADVVTFPLQYILIRAVKTMQW